MQLGIWRPTDLTRCWLVLSTTLSCLSVGYYVPGPSFFPSDWHTSSEAVDALRRSLDSELKTHLGQRDDLLGDSWAAQISTSHSNIWSLYHEVGAQVQLNSGPATSAINGESLFRIASISKTLTIYALLRAHDIRLDDPITKFIPELISRVDHPRSVQWDQISLRSLASHLSGVHRDTAGPCFVWRQVSDTWKDIDLNSQLDHEAWDNGLYKVQPNNTCTYSAVIERARTALRVFQPNERPTYSNAGFTLLGVALERATGMSFKRAVADLVLRPLSMHRTLSMPSNLSAKHDSSKVTQWATDVGADLPSSGFYSTPNDLSRLLRSILRAELLPRAKINAWLKPQTWTESGSSSAYGLGWEHLRTTRLTQDGRAIEIISKGGALQGYYSSIMLIPELDIGLSVLVAGEMSTMNSIRESVVRALVPAVETIIEHQMPARYVGTYCIAADCNVRMVVRAARKGPGLIIAEWKVDGTDMLVVLGLLQGVSVHDHSRPTVARLVPADKDDSKHSESWRLAFVPDSRGQKEAEGIFDDLHLTDVDGSYVGMRSLREIEFHMNNISIADEILVPALDLRLTRTHVPM